MSWSVFPLRVLVVSIALLLAGVGLAGCHDLTGDLGAQQDDGDGDSSGDTGGGGDTGGDDGSEGDDGGEGEDDGDDEEDDGDGDAEEDENGEDEENGNGTGGDDENETVSVEEGDWAADHEVQIVTNATAPCGGDIFDPDSLEIEVGEVVQWVNAAAGCSHTATSGDAYGEPDDHFDTGAISSSGGESEYTYRFNEPGTYAYYCSFHPDMQIAQIVVSEP